MARNWEMTTSIDNRHVRHWCIGVEGTLSGKNYWCLLHGKMKSSMYIGSPCVCVCVCVSVYLCIIKNVSEFVRSLASRVLEIS